MKYNRVGYQTSVYHERLDLIPVPVTCVWLLNKSACLLRSICSILVVFEAYRLSRRRLRRMRMRRRMRRRTGMDGQGGRAPLVDGVLV